MSPLNDRIAHVAQCVDGTSSVLLPEHRLFGTGALALSCGGKCACVLDLIATGSPEPFGAGDGVEIL